jgi:peptidoglycan biosynthesis protein MviN/MurJ (putative lipid II flippase)
VVTAKERDFGPDQKSQVTKHKSPEERVVPRIRRRAVWIGVVLSLGAFLLGWKRGVSLTICAAVVIFSFLVFEKLTGRFVTPREKWRIRAVVPLLLVTAAAVALLAFVLHWKEFDPVAGAVGLSSVVLAIGAEIFHVEGERS